MLFYYKKIFISLLHMVASEILNLQDANNIGKKKQVVLMKEHHCTLKTTKVSGRIL